MNLTFYESDGSSDTMTKEGLYRGDKEGVEGEEEPLAKQASHTNLLIEIDGVTLSRLPIDGPARA